MSESKRVGVRALNYALDTDLLIGFWLIHELRNTRRILEVGSGPPSRSWIRLLGKPKLSVGVGLDTYRPYLTQGGPSSSAWGAYVLGRGNSLPFGDRSFDAAIGCDVIEHLRKNEALQMISEMKRVSRSVVILITPNGMLHQEADRNPFQAHLSGWDCQEFKRLGFRVSGLRGIKPLRKEHADFVIRPRALGYLVSTLTVPIAAMNPKWAFDLGAVYRPDQSS